MSSNIRAAFFHHSGAPIIRIHPGGANRQRRIKRQVFFPSSYSSSSVLSVPCRRFGISSAAASSSSSSSATSLSTTTANTSEIEAITLSSSSSSRFTATSAIAASSTTAPTTRTNSSTSTSVIVDSDSSLYSTDRIALDQLQSPFLQALRDRGFLHQCTNILELDQCLLRKGETERVGEEGEAVVHKEVVSAYLGFDATATSLHVGSLLPIMILRWLQRTGHRPVVLIGGGTSKVGDPTGKDVSRTLLSDDSIQTNIDGITSVFAKFLTFAAASDNNASHSNSSSSRTDAILVNNNDWLSQLQYLDFLRDYGPLFTINRMLSAESVKQRLAREAPFTFLEFNYMILQAYDFVELHRRHDVTVQLGGSDQWGNMLAGVELARKVGITTPVFALTSPLLTTSDGKKMGKTAGGAVWLNADLCSPYEYWQYWRNTADADTLRFLKLYTELPLDYIDSEFVSLTGSALNSAKIKLADEATALLHGQEALPIIHETIARMFGGKSNNSAISPSISTEGLPRMTVSIQQLQQQHLQQQNDNPSGTTITGIRIVDVLVQLGLAGSKKEARRLIAGGGARLIRLGGGQQSQQQEDPKQPPMDDEEVKVMDEWATLSVDDFTSPSREVVLRAGKKRAGVIELVKDKGE